MVSPGFFIICAVHSVVAITCGSLLMFCSEEMVVLSHGREQASKLIGSTAHDQLLIRTSDSFSGLLLTAVGVLVLMVAFVKDREFQSFFAKGCVFLHLMMAIWRLSFEREILLLAHDCLRLLLADFAFGLSWLFFLVCSWTEMYD
ncbi:transmembrane protein [Perilla frutescens var. hirtella]|uniref:Transmembrane protein n=1 Tax=Perilla frutescens var. hirtella TaxID=608512 RepID=A0AAD4JJB3_PERFH|nr:transmembrane protein [Perilla frutescens var. frutescens]KAH6786467.1 transmembrane protein [Perilla frutescens var. hirtella]KAH6834832.1 transmembrane protein [Perilla frutescens var. hirtella]